MATDDRFETATGTLVVSKPYRSSRSKNLRAVISFIPRNSAFDINNVSSSTNEFRVCFFLAIYLHSPLPYLSGLLYAFLDIFVHLRPSELCTKYRDQWSSSQPSLCYDVLTRRYYPCSQ